MTLFSFPPVFGLVDRFGIALDSARPALDKKVAGVELTEPKLQNADKHDNASQQREIHQ